MLKTGTCSINELILQKNTTLFRKSLKNISISLYKKACLSDNANKLTQQILFGFSDDRGAYKRTYSQRFLDFDKQILKILKQTLPQNDQLTAHDVGVSDARTSVNFFNGIRELYPQIKLIASDYNPSIKILQKEKLIVALGHSNRILEITYSPFVFNFQKTDNYILYPLNYFIRKTIEFFMVRPLVHQYINGDIEAENVFLFSPCALNLEKNNKSFELAEHNILKPFNNKYNIIRAMNILNLSYFTHEEFQIIIKNIYHGLADNALFITGSNQDANTLVNGAVYQKYSNGFKLVWTSGTGSHIHDHISSFSL